MRQQRQHQVRRISDYVESQAHPETVTHAERMMLTKVMGQEHEVWDVPTDQDRYWVVTNMTNLYAACADAATAPVRSQGEHHDPWLPPGGC